MYDDNTPPSAAAKVTQQQQEDGDNDEFASFCLPNDVLRKLLEEVEEELGLNQSIFCAASPPHEQQEEDEMPSLTQLVDDDCHSTMSEQNAAERKRLVNHMLQMRASLERYLTQKLAYEPHQPSSRMLFQKIRQFAALKSHPKNVSVQAFCTSMHIIRDYGNKAAHDQEAPRREECLAAVAKYTALKADYEHGIA